MSDDLLERMTAAMRETTSAPPDELERARQRARLLTQARKRTGLRPQTLWQWAAVIVAGFFVSTAMAHVISVQGPRLLRALRSEEPEAAPAKAARRAKASRPRAVPADVPALAGAADATVPQPPAAVEPSAVASDSEAVVQPAQAQPSAAGSVVRPQRPARARARPAAVKPAVASSSEPTREEAGAPEPPELRLFRAAQALHVARDPRAIAAWDAYLQKASTGPLVPEAKYNRALGLVRAQRYADARSALAPFAQGAFGAYRQREALALLERLPE